MIDLPMPEGLDHWTADEVAECLSYEKHLPPETERQVNRDSLYSVLWSFLGRAQNPTPIGGDGTDGTVETPCGRLSPDNDDKAPHWWADLLPYEQRAIAAAYADECGEVAL